MIRIALVFVLFVFTACVTNSPASDSLRVVVDGEVRRDVVASEQIVADMLELEASAPTTRRSCHAGEVVTELTLAPVSISACATLDRVSQLITTVDQLSNPEIAFASSACTRCAGGDEYSCCVCGGGGLSCWILLF